MNPWLAIGITILLLLGNAFFVGAEFAVLTARRDRLEALAASNARARTALRAGEKLPLLIAGAQLGVTVCTLLLGALSEPAFATLLEAPMDALGAPAALRHALGFALGLVVVTILHTLLGEMVPKNLAIAGPERAAMWLVPVHYGFCRLTKPLLDLFTAISTAVLKLLKVTPKDELDAAYTPVELASLIGESRREGLLDQSEHRRLAKTLRGATSRTVADVLVPLANTTTLPSEPTIGDVADAVAATGFSRYPVRDARGRLTGYLHIKDVLDRAGEPRETPVPRGRVRGLPELPSDARVDDAISALRRAQSHLGAAVGGDGAVLGVVALEDLVEEYVGTVRDGTHVSSG
ncbi:hemolysin family protein [Sciscionella marina]|uniref:hemolysin family protein n=1 Tax=Sciscionella marina TaxID=508770 RepID=UPI00035DFE25|nr:hemolysin family protein [Sciscionella marina]